MKQELRICRGTRTFLDEDRICLYEDGEVPRLGMYHSSETQYQFGCRAVNIQTYHM